MQRKFHASRQLDNAVSCCTLLEKIGRLNRLWVLDSISLGGGVMNYKSRSCSLALSKMKILFEQVARIAKRGRKRWLGLVFVTQLPQHLPRQVFGLVNSYILHKITDAQVVSTLRRTVSGIDDSLWNHLPALAPG